jgi:hypothetical protein
MSQMVKIFRFMSNIVKFIYWGGSPPGALTGAEVYQRLVDIEAALEEVRKMAQRVERKVYRNGEDSENLEQILQPAPAAQSSSIWDSLSAGDQLPPGIQL